MDSPNIVLIVADGWRGGCLGCAGHPAVHTPRLDHLARQGARFTHAYSATPNSISARVSLHTGWSQHRHGRVGEVHGVPWDYPVLLAGEFTRHGYQTLAVGKMHVSPARSQLGFQHVVLHDGLPQSVIGNADLTASTDDYLPWLHQQMGRACDVADHGLGCHTYITRPWDKPEDLHPSNFVVSQGLEFLRRRDPGKPFFLMLSFARPRPPLDPPVWAFEEYRGVSEPMPPVGEWCTERERDLFPSPAVGAERGGDAALMARARAAYYAHITHLDIQVGRFLDRVAASGLSRSTYVCFTSVHGMLLGDHHLAGEHYPYEGVVRVPLLLLGPDDAPWPSGSCSDALVELRDLLPTLLGCAGLPVPEDVEGNSLVPLIAGDHVGEWRSYLHGESIIGDQSVQWLTDGGEKYVWFSGTGAEQLFDLSEDPGERQDLALKRRHAEHIAHWRQILTSVLMDREEGFTDGRQLIVGRPVSPCLTWVWD